MTILGVGTKGAHLTSNFGPTVKFGVTNRRLQQYTLTVSRKHTMDASQSVATLSLCSSNLASSLILPILRQRGNQLLVSTKMAHPKFPNPSSNHKLGCAGVSLTRHGSDVEGAATSCTMLASIIVRLVRCIGMN